MFRTFSLTLMVNHACNLRCSYCYTGLKFQRRMEDSLGRLAIDRSVAALEERGVLELGFFGGEPLLEAEQILGWIEYAVAQCDRRGQRVQVNLTTNGTVGTSVAWQVMRHPLVMLSVSHDGLPEVHDLHRVTGDGHGSAATVDSTLHELIAERREFNVVMVVRPDTVEQLPDGISYLYDLGVRQITPSLDLWTQWTRADADKPRIAIAKTVNFWAEHYPQLAISWFDEKAAHLAKVPFGETARCQFGSGQIAVSPAGNLYPCERLIGEDKADNPMRLKISLSDATDFASTKQFPEKSSEICDSCVLNTMCGTSCRCSNYIRTGDVQRPDGLLCLLEAACFQEVARVATTKQREPVSATKQCEVHHVGV